MLHTKMAQGSHCPAPNCLQWILTALSNPSHHIKGQVEKVSYKVYVCDWHVVFIRGLAGWFRGLAGRLHLYGGCGCDNGTG